MQQGRESRTIGRVSLAKQLCHQARDISRLIRLQNDARDCRIDRLAIRLGGETRSDDNRYVRCPVPHPGRKPESIHRARHFNICDYCADRGAIAHDRHRSIRTLGLDYRNPGILQLIDEPFG